MEIRSAMTRNSGRERHATVFPGTRAHRAIPPAFPARLRDREAPRGGL